MGYLDSQSGGKGKHLKLSGLLKMFIELQLENLFS